MIGVASQVARVAIFYFATSMREAVPDRFALAVFVPRAFDLIGGSGRAPKKFLGKVEVVSNCLARKSSVATDPPRCAAFDDTVRAENNPAGSAAATPAANTDCANSRRLRRKVG